MKSPAGVRWREIVMRVRPWMYGVLVLAGGLAALPLHAAPADPEDLRPGLLARYRSLSDSEATLTRLDRKPAFRLDHSSPHSRIPPGPFEATWSGMLLVNDEGPIRFEAYVLGELTVEVDGMVVLQGRGEQESTRLAGKQTLAREPGSYPLKIRYRSLPRGPARLQLWWQGPTFAPEPLPAWHLKHLPADLPEALAREQAAQKGRAAAEQLGCARCHARAFPGIDAPAPGPSLADLGGRLSRAWLLDWLEDPAKVQPGRSEEHTSELQSLRHLVCRLLLEKKKKKNK